MSKIQVLADSVPSESHFPGLQTDAFMLYPHMIERDHLSHVSSYEVTNPIHESSTLIS